MIKFEHINQPLLPREEWLSRVLKSVWFAVVIVAFALIFGVVGYYTLGGLSLVDSILEASMILGGMGAVAPMTNDAVKLFASFYALMSGLVVLGTTTIVLAPWIHRLLHRFHAQNK
jgi:hypothetical protein